MDIVQRLRFDAARCEVQFSKGVAGNIEEAAAEIERLRGYLSGAGINLVTASIVIGKLAGEAEAAPFKKASDAVLEGLRGTAEQPMRAKEE